jgi:hypothetical protein
VVGRNVEELAGRARHAMPKSVDEGRARRAILERQDGVIVGRTRELDPFTYSWRLSSGCSL